MGISAQELRLGNLIYLLGYDFNEGGRFLDGNKEEMMVDTVVLIELEKESEDFEAIPLTEEWLLKLPKNVTIPSHVIYVHQLQNWFFFNFNKELS